MAAVIFAAAIAAVAFFVIYLVSQLVLPASRTQNLGLYIGVAAIAGLVGALHGLLGGLLGSAVLCLGWILGRQAGVSVVSGAWLMGACAALGALGAVAATNPSPGGWLAGTVGVAIFGCAVGLYGLRYARRPQE